MSTPNFEFMKYDMPLIVADMDYNDLKEQYEQEYGDDELSFMTVEEAKNAIDEVAD